MKRIPIISSSVASAGWEDDVLEIEFNNGKIYQYSSILETMFKQLMTAKSKGKWVYKHVVKGGYKFKKKGK